MKIKTVNELYLNNIKRYLFKKKINFNMIFSKNMLKLRFGNYMLLINK